jgi:hypothetical protein
MGQTHRRLARLASSDSERARHVAAAREAWTQTKRSDLLAKLNDEFN